MLDVAKALIERKSVRAFTGNTVDKSLIIQILEHAKHAPSGTNTQPWKVGVVSGETKHKLDSAFNNEPKSMDYTYYPKEFTLDLKRRRIACGLQMYQTLGIERGDIERRRQQWELNYSAFGAPVALYVFLPKIIEKGSFLDCGMFVQSIALMATHLGLATCIQAALAEYPDIIRKHLQLSDDLQLVCGIALGYEDSSALVNSYKTPREDLANFVQFFA